MTISTLTLLATATLDISSNGKQNIQASYILINGEVLMDADFENNEIDKFSANYIYFGGGSSLTVNIFGVIDSIKYLFEASNNISGLPYYQNIKYQLSSDATHIWLSSKPANNVNNESELNTEITNPNFVVELSSYVSLPSSVSFSESGLLYGNGYTFDGGNTVAGFEINSSIELEFDDINFSSFTDSAIKVNNAGATIIVNSDKKEVVFNNNTADINIVSGKVNLQATNNSINLNSAIKGDVGAKLEKNGNQEVKIGQDAVVEYKGEFNIQGGAVKVAAATVHISTLIVNVNAQYSSADGSTHTAYVDKAELYGTLEFGLNNNAADIIFATHTVIVNVDTVFNIVPFTQGLSLGTPIALVQTRGAIAGNVDTSTRTYTYNGQTISYYLSQVSAGILAPPRTAYAANLSLAGIYAYILGISGSLNGLNAAFIANTLKFGAISNDTNIFENIDRNVWVSGGVNGKTIKDEDNGDFKSDGYGVQAGVKVYNSDSVKGGLFIGYNGKSFKQAADKADASDIEIGTYWGFLGKALDFKTALSAGFQNISAKSADSSKADFDAFSIRLNVEAQYNMGIFKPFIGIQSGFVQNSKIEEKKNGAVSATIDADNYIRVETLLGAKIGQDGADFSWYAKLNANILAAGAKKEYTANNGTSETKFNSTEETALTFDIGVGLGYAISKAMDIFINAGINVGADTFGYQANVGAGFKF
jgi:hypothetical protein